MEAASILVSTMPTERHGNGVRRSNRAGVFRAHLIRSARPGQRVCEDGGIDRAIIEVHFV